MADNRIPARHGLVRRGQVTAHCRMSSAANAALPHAWKPTLVLNSGKATVKVVALQEYALNQLSG
ncbi:hypothetical protein M3484_23390, partial [Pseudomonas sp. GX19020]|uniref:hypothetical protein n=1 Tax=Pseudomonas sp. GX19020 TaxID=2942277 RepID=UPI0020196EE2